MMKNHPHPGELLREDVLVPLGIEVTEALGTSGLHWHRIINGKSLAIGPDLAHPSGACTSVIPPISTGIICSPIMNCRRPKNGASRRCGLCRL